MSSIFPGMTCIVINSGPDGMLKSNLAALVKVEHVDASTGECTCSPLSSVLAWDKEDQSYRRYSASDLSTVVMFDCYQLCPLMDPYNETVDETLELSGYPPDLQMEFSMGRTRLSLRALNNILQDAMLNSAIERLDTTMDRLMDDPRFGKFIKPRPRLN